jgi:hypothetical protein
MVAIEILSNQCNRSHQISHALASAMHVAVHNRHSVEAKCRRYG